MICTSKEIIEALHNGEVVGIPTDTVYGFACLKEYSEKVYELKRRPKDKKLITFISSIKDIGKVDEFSEEELATLTKNYWPGQNTLIFLQNQKLKSYRIPSEENILDFLNELKMPLLTTSANISGENTCLTKEEFESRFPTIKLLKEKKNTIKTGQASNIYLVSKERIQKIR